MTLVIYKDFAPNHTFLHYAYEFGHRLLILLVGWCVAFIVSTIFVPCFCQCHSIIFPVIITVKIRVVRRVVQVIVCIARGIMTKVAIFLVFEALETKSTLVVSVRYTAGHCRDHGVRHGTGQCVIQPREQRLVHQTRQYLVQAGCHCRSYHFGNQTSSLDGNLLQCRGLRSKRNVREKLI